MHTENFQDRRSQIIPDSLSNPLALLWVNVLPQIILLLLNLRSYWIVSGEMNAAQLSVARQIFASELFLIAGSAALALVCVAMRKRIAWAANWPLLVLHIACLWFFSVKCGSLIPNSVAFWMLPPEQVLYDQFAFMMPATFFAALRLACFSSDRKRHFDLAVSAGILLGIPCFWALAIRTLGRLLSWRGAETVVAVAIVVSTVIAFGACLRVLMLFYNWFQEGGRIRMAVFTFLVGIAGPVGGLLLNRQIPFPADFQTWSVYAMTIANGALLLLPIFNRPRLDRLVWLAQCLLFPFTLYFFTVFLPFLPLALLATVAAGTGFLILAPTLLFVLHGQRLADGFRRENQTARRLVPFAMAALAFAVIPMVVTAEALIDRVVLRGAIGFIYSPDYNQSGRFSGSPRVVKRSLQRLRDFKDGLQLPFLSRYYNWIVFDNLVLPDEKMSFIHEAFFGTDFDEKINDSGSIFGSGNQRRRRTWTALRENSSRVRRAIAEQPPPRLVNLTETKLATEDEGGCKKTLVTLTMRNSGNVQGEFVTTLNVPEGVFVSGFWLNIGNERVAGRIFEKKSAMWIYEKIRDASRRDPGMLIYTAPATIEMRVFPFAANETRTAQIEFLYPKGFGRNVQIGTETLPLGTRSDERAIVLSVDQAGGASLAITDEAMHKLPATTRTPYLHFIVDRSAVSKISPDQLRQTIRNVAEKFPRAKDCIVTSANYECDDVTDGVVPIEAALASGIHSEKMLPLRGSLMSGRAMKRGLIWYHGQFTGADAKSPWLQRYPVFVVIRESKQAPAAEEHLPLFERMAPEASAYCVTENGAELEWYDFDGKRSTADDDAHPVLQFKIGDFIEACRADAKTSQLLSFPTQGAVGIFDPATTSFQSVPTSTISAGTRYSNGTAAWRDSMALIFDPALENSALSNIVKLCRESGILSSQTSYIVLENSAQWKVLELKERQKLRNLNALEFEETPEPSTWMMIAIGAVVLIVARRATVRRMT